MTAPAPFAPHPATDTVVSTGPVPIAVRDHGGDGPPLLLLHGGGANLAAMTPLAARLRGRYRVITPDLRGHGRSGDGPWDWDAVLDDLAAVAGALRLERPAVVGWSLGGMAAAHWARRTPDCPGAVNIDGNPTPTRPEQLPGLDPGQAAAELDRLHALFDAMSAGPPPMTRAQADALIEQQRQAALGGGAFPGDARAATTERNLVPEGEVLRLRPAPDTLAQIQRALRELDVFALYRDARVPVLALHATRNLPHQEPFAGLYDAYRAWLRERLAATAAAVPLLSGHHLPDASHAMVAEDPDRVAAVVADFLAAAG
ncbi:alpha/beta fold hydrolase [Allonocardiopsis opalescens]|uniref:Pimeloyl-ACP methyl ester carboxylesterase n=1 Tax=Allonocardiopsis opalescens TaxID=1144618 RepID=A0A2T0Q5U1_9ACTN|nr:alpha/beta hydrolase [Allonocardiopsis opalescens]PRX99081.1 pimeloyl-ACP methyl ester carboxylesterase [Allonocardiopsis opalescens]